MENIAALRTVGCEVGDETFRNHPPVCKLVPAGQVTVDVLVPPGNTVVGGPKVSAVVMDTVDGVTVAQRTLTAKENPVGTSFRI